MSMIPNAEASAKMIPLRLQTVLTIAMCAAFACCTLLGGISFIGSIGEHRSLSLGAAELARFHLALEVADAVSGERAPANSAMGPSDGNQEALLVALDAKRAATDRKIDALRRVFQSDIAASGRISGLLTTLSLRLAEGRLAVDTVAGKPLEQRGSEDIIRAIEAMFRAADAATDLRDSLGQAIVTLTPQIGTEVMLGTTAGSLRESAGRLGSYVVMMLAADPQEDRRLLLRFNRGAGQLEELHDIIRNYAAAALPGEGVVGAIRDVEQFYFKGAMPFAERTAAIEAADNSMSAATFTRQYIPGIRHVEVLRQKILATSTERLASLQAAALARVATAAALIGIICVILTLLAFVFKRSLFNPLLVARAQVLAIAEGDLSEPKVKSGLSPEVRDMFEGLEVLRQQQRQKRELEAEQSRLSERLKTLAERDYLTGLMNRRAIEAHAARRIADADDEGADMAALIIDIDHFKAINDTYGHGVGDTVLQKVAAIFADRIKPGDAVSRFGGEEFLVLLGQADAAEAAGIAERMRRHLAGTVLDEHPGLRITASFGVAVRKAGSGLAWERLLQTADKRLYAAKRAGRNRVCHTDEDEAAERRPRLA